MEKYGCLWIAVPSAMRCIQVANIGSQIKQNLTICQKPTGESLLHLCALKLVHIKIECLILCWQTEILVYRDECLQNIGKARSLLHLCALKLIHIKIECLILCWQTEVLVYSGDSFTEYWQGKIIASLVCPQIDSH